MDDYQRKDLTLKRISALFVVVGGILAVGRYWYTTNKEIELEVNRYSVQQEQALLQKQFDLYFEASRLAAFIATATDQKKTWRRDAVIRKSLLWPDGHRRGAGC